MKPTWAFVAFIVNLVTVGMCIALLVRDGGWVPLCDGLLAATLAVCMVRVMRYAQAHGLTS